jgi:hypothetical protein
MRSPASAPPAPRRSSPKSACIWPASLPQATWCHGPSSRPRTRQSAGKSKPGSTGKSKPGSIGKGNPWLGEVVIGAAKTKTFLGTRYHRLARRRGKRRAVVAVGNSILTIAHRLLSDPAARFSDLGPDWHDRIAPLRRKRQVIAELERLSGKKVISRRPPPAQAFLIRLRCAPPGTAARPAKHRFSETGSCTHVAIRVSPHVSRAEWADADPSVSRRLPPRASFASLPARGVRARSRQSESSGSP